MKYIARTLNQILHPLLMPVLGLLLILNSGTYLSLLDPGAKRVLLLVLGMGTLLFPLLAFPMLHYRRVMSSATNQPRPIEEALLPRLVILVLYIITLVYFLRLPVNRLIQAYVLSFTLVMLFYFLSGIRYRLCAHMAGFGGLIALLLTLMLLYEIPLQGMLVLVVIAAGISGSTRLYLSLQKPAEELAGFMLGFVVVGATLLLY